MNFPPVRKGVAGVLHELTFPVNLANNNEEDFNKFYSSFASIYFPYEKLTNILTHFPTRVLKRAQDPTVQLEKGELIILRGTSGCGKSYFAKCVAHAANIPLLSLGTCGQFVFEDDRKSHRNVCYAMDAIRMAHAHYSALVVLIDWAENVFGPARPRMDPDVAAAVERARQRALEQFRELLQLRGLLIIMTTEFNVHADVLALGTFVPMNLPSTDVLVRLIIEQTSHRLSPYGSTLTNITLAAKKEFSKILRKPYTYPINLGYVERICMCFVFKNVMPHLLKGEQVPNVNFKSLVPLLDEHLESYLPDGRVERRQ